MRQYEHKEGGARSTDQRVVLPPVAAPLPPTDVAGHAGSFAPSPRSTTAANPRRFRDTEEAADYCGCSIHLLIKLRTAGGGPTYHQIGSGKGGAIRYAEADLDAWLDSRKRTSTSDSGTEAHAAA
jgi:hypothetical protein